MMDLKEDDLLMCTVMKVEGTTVFIKTESNEPGTIVFSEIAAGRIRNIRQHVTPNKKIVCKVLRIAKGNLELSLRRVTATEREQVLDEYKKEKSLLGMLKAITSSPDSILEKVKSSYTIDEFLDEARQNPKILENFVSKDEAEKLSKTLEEKQGKIKTVKKTFTLSSTSPTGIIDIKNTLSSKEESIKIIYLGSSRFEISSSAEDFKTAEANLEIELSNIQKLAKEKRADFEIKGKK